MNVVNEMLYKQLIVSLLILTLPLLGFSQTKKEKVLEESFENKEILSIEHRKGPLLIKKSTDNLVHVKSKLIVEAEDPAVAQVVFEKVEIDYSSSGRSLHIETNTNIKNWRIVTLPKRNKLVFKDGTTVKGVKKIRVEMTVYVPTQVKSIDISSKYESIDLEGTTAKTIINLYSGTLTASQSLGDLDLKLKYCKVYLKDIGNATLDLYDSKMEAGQAGDLTIDSKYSKVEFGEVKSLNLEAYDDKYKFKAVDGPLNLTDKYSDFDIKTMQNAELNLYDSDFRSDQGGDLRIKSKYSKFFLGKFKDLKFTGSHDDDIQAEEVENFTSESKYSKYNFSVLNGGIELDSHDDDLNVSRTVKGLGEINIKAKYTNIDLPITEKCPHRLEAKFKYGKLDYNENSFETHIYREKDSEVEVKAKMKGAGENSPLIKIEAYDSKVKLRS